MALEKIQAGTSRVGAILLGLGWSILSLMHPKATGPSNAWYKNIGFALASYSSQLTFPTRYGLKQCHMAIS